MLLVVLFIKLSIEKQKLARLGIDDIDKLSGRDFEKYLAVLFGKQGYKVTLTKYIGDYGADLVVENSGDKIVVQAKRYKGSVGVKAVQAAVAAKGIYQCQRAMVVTNSTFTEQAKKLARANKVELWDRKKLIDNLSALEGTAISESKASSVFEPDQQVCATCGKKVTEKVREHCANNAARFKGLVYYCFDCQRK